MTLADFFVKYPRAVRFDCSDGTVHVSLHNCGDFLETERYNARAALHRLEDYVVTGGYAAEVHLERLCPCGCNHWLNGLEE